MKLELKLEIELPFAHGQVDLRRLPAKPGVYVFARRHGAKFEALYVGKAENLITRVQQQLNNLKLMRHIEDAKTGARVLIVGQFKAKPKQTPQKALPIIEKAMIQHFVSEGHRLVNVQGTKVKEHTVDFTGPISIKGMPQNMIIPE